MAYLAMLLALCFVTTLIGFPTVFGFIHFGDAVALFAAVVLGPAFGAVAAALGGALADLVLGYAVYAPATLVIRALMVLVCSAVLRGRTESFVLRLLASLSAEILMAVGYAGYHVFLYGGWEASLAALPTDLLQAAVSMMIFVLAAGTVSRIPQKLRHDGSNNSKKR